MYNVLLHLKRSHSLGDFFRFVDTKPDAANLLQVYARANDVEMLRDFYYQDDRRRETACLALEESMSIIVRHHALCYNHSYAYAHPTGSQTFGEKMAKIRIAAKSFGEDKDSGFESKVCQRTLDLVGNG